MLNLTSLLWLLWATWIHEKWMKIGWAVAGYGRMQSEVPSFPTRSIYRRFPYVKCPFITFFLKANYHKSSINVSNEKLFITHSGYEISLGS